MNDLHKPRLHGAPSRRPDDLDGLLRRFFRSEMPHPWPAAPTLPKSRAVVPFPRRHTRRPWLAFSMRFAVAASVALLVTGYLSLAGRFSSQGAARGPHIRPENPISK